MAEEENEQLESDDAVPELMSGELPVGIEPDEDAVLSDDAWARIWQIPALLLGAVLLAVGLYLATPRAEENNFTAAMDSVEQYFYAGNFDSAEALLQSMTEYIGQGKERERARYKLLWGDLIFLQQREQGWDNPDNHQRVIESYFEAEQLGYAFEEDPPRLQRWAETLVALNRLDEVEPILNRLKDEPARRRCAILKRMIEQGRTGLSRMPASQTASLLARFLDELRTETDAVTRRSEEIWAVGLRARLFLEAGAFNRVIDYLNPRRATLTSRGGDADLVPLIVILAKAYQQVGQYEEAQREYQYAQLKLAEDKTHVLHADILVGQAQIALASDNDLQVALELFSAAVDNYPATPPYFDAVVGQADCEALYGTHGPALEHFGVAIKHLVSLPDRSPDEIKTLIDRILSHYQLHFDAGDYDLALDYLSLVLPIYDDQIPSDLLSQFALTHQKIAETRIAGVTPANDQVLIAAQSLDESARIANREAAVHFAKAADYFYEYAGAMTIIDDQAHGDSLWQAAMNYDKAQLWERAIEVYSEFRKTRPSEPRQQQATKRLGMAYQANGQYKLGADVFKQLIDAHPQNRHAHASRVPLARCHIALGQFSTALGTLQEVVNDHPAITPESSEYRDALIELGQLYHRMGRFEPAIKRLEEAVERYRQGEDGGLLESYLADAYRQSNRQLETDLKDTVAESRRLALRKEQVRRLEQAQAYYSQAINMLESRDLSSLSPIERLFLRNNYFYRADCAYNLARYEEAIDWYDQAAKRWEQHPATLVARMQIVNAYCAMKQYEDAKAAMSRAQYAFNRIPQSAFDDPNLPISRKHWQDWFRWTSELGLFDQAAMAPSQD